MSGTDSPAPPQGARIPVTTSLHGDQRVDDYAWMRNKSDPTVAAYLNAENDYTDAVMADTVELQSRLYDEILSHIEQTDADPPYRFNGYLYYSRTEESKQYPIYCRKQGTLDAAEEITLDLNAMAEGLEFLSLGTYRISDDSRLAAFSTDTTGFRQYTLQIKDLTTGELLPDRIEKTGSVAWAADNRTLYYTIEDHAKRHYRLYRHTLGADPANDALIYEETDEMFSVGVKRSRSGGYLFLTSSSHTASEVRYLDAARAEGSWQLVTPRSPMHEYYLDHHSDSFYILTNSAGINFRVVTASVSDPSRDRWREIVPHRDDVMLEGLSCFKGHVVLSEREAGLPHIKILSLDGASGYRLEFPEPAYSVGPSANFEFDTQTLRYSYQSMVIPSSTYDFDVTTKKSTLIKQTHVPGGFKSENYESHRIFATATDGTKVPISLVRRRGTPQDGSAPLFLYAYGSYGAPMPAYFSSSALALLDRGFVYAIAHIRGGGELGKAWHDAGRMHNKRNTFTDFIAGAEALLKEGYGSPNKLVVEGGSAGGLLMGAVANMRPDLFTAVISKVPFVDVINTMLDETLPLTIGEFEEWGNPKIEADYRYMKTYCPYSNLERKAYPAMLVKTSFNDSQVMYWEPAKYVAKLRTLKTDSNPLLLKTNMAAGHGGASGRYDRIKEIALDFAFILKQFGLG